MSIKVVEEGAVQFQPNQSFPRPLNSSSASAKIYCNHQLQSTSSSLGTLLMCWLRLEVWHCCSRIHTSIEEVCLSPSTCGHSMFGNPFDEGGPYTQETPLTNSCPDHTPW